MTFCTRGFRAMNLVIGLCSFGGITRTTCIFPIWELGPHNRTTCDSQDSKWSSNPGCPVP